MRGSLSDHRDGTRGKNALVRRTRVCSNTLIRLNGVAYNNVKITMDLPTTTTNRVTTLVFSGTRRVNRQVAGGRASLVKGVNFTTRPPKRLPRRAIAVKDVFQRNVALTIRRLPRHLVNRRLARTTLTMGVGRVPINLDATLRSPSLRPLLPRLIVPTIRPNDRINAIPNLVTRRPNELRPHRRQHTLFSRRNLGVALRKYFPPLLSV